MQDLDLANNIFAGIAIGKLAFINIMWFIYFRAGTTIEAYYRWTWLSTLAVMYFAWGPVILSWAIMLTGSSLGDTMFFYSSLASISGPMVGYFIPIVILILAYNERKDTGLIYTSKVHFWMGWWFAVMITFTSIFVEIAFLPGIRVWYDIK